MAQLAAAHPGKMGDALYSLPAMRYIYGQTGSHFDFYTSEYCEPLRTLFEYQPYINNFIVSDTYKVERTDMGCQPAHVPIPDKYDAVYQFGFTEIPDTSLHQYMARKVGINVDLGVRYEYPEMTESFKKMLRDQGVTPGEYVVLAPRNPSSYQALFNELAERLPAVIIGLEHEYDGYGIDMTGLDFLETCTILSQARAFIGLMSSQLVLANGFDIPRIAPHDARSWDMRHVVNTHLNHYPVMSDVETLIRLTEGSH